VIFRLACRAVISKTVQPITLAVLVREVALPA
jgi:hypothetical protein